MSRSNRPSRTDDEIREIFASVDNARRWGADDELGTLNHITPQKRIEAAALVRTGTVVSLAHPLVAGSVTGRPHFERRMMYNRSADAELGTPMVAADHFGLDVHQQDVTHLDAVAHIGSHEGRVYNGRDFNAMAGADGVTFGSVFAQRSGIVSRGVLLDVATALGLQWLDPSHEIMPADLEAAERHAGVRVSTGDVVVVRAGTDEREAAEGVSPQVAGPGPDAAVWLHERGVAVYTGDAPEHITMLGALILGRLKPDDLGDEELESTRFPLPFHQIAIPAMGLVLLDHARVEELALHCGDIGRHEFLFVAAPLPLTGGTGSPVNPLAIL